MPQPETPRVPALGETHVVEPTEPTAPSQATGSEPTNTEPNQPVTEPTTAEVIEREKYDALQKEFEKAQMRANQLENDQRRKRDEELAKQEEWKTLAEERQARLDELEAEKAEEKQAQEATEFRNKIIDEYPENVQKVAKALIAKDKANFSWKEATDWDDAKTQLTEQLNTLAETLGSAPSNDETGTQNSPTVHPNNPATRADKPTSEMSLEELRKFLPVSDRTY